MAIHRYIYKGTETVHVPEFSILAVGGDKHTVYETDKQFDHPDFEEVKEITRDQRKQASDNAKEDASSK